MFVLELSEADYLDALRQLENAWAGFCPLVVVWPANRVGAYHFATAWATGSEQDRLWKLVPSHKCGWAPSSECA